MPLETLAGLIRGAGIEMPGDRPPESPDMMQAIQAMGLEGYLQSRGLADARPGNLLYDALTWGLQSFTGRSINPHVAMTFSAVYSAVSQISQTVASLPLHVYREFDNNSKELAKSDYRYRMLRYQPNREMSSFQWREFVVQSLLLWGNSYNYLDIDSRGKIRAIWPLRPDWVMVLRNDNNRLVFRYMPMYYYNIPVEPGTYEDWQILHIPGLGFDGTIGYSPITMAREAVSLGLASQEFAGRFFANNARPNLLLTNEGASLDPQKFRETWNSQFGGLENAGKVGVLTGGKWSVQSFSISPRDAQFLEGRNFDISEVARIYNMPPNRLGDPNGKAATYASAEQSDLDYAKHTIRPWIERIEQKMDMTVLGSQSALMCKHDMTELLRGDLSATATAYAAFVEKGILLRDEVRNKLDMNPLPDGAGGAPTVQQQTTLLSTALQKPPAQPDQGATNA